MLIIIMLHSILLLCVVHVTAVRCWQRPSQAMVGDRRGYAGSHTPRRTIGKSTSESLHKSGAYSMYCSVVTDFSTSNSVVFFPSSYIWAPLQRTTRRRKLFEIDTRTVNAFACERVAFTRVQRHTLIARYRTFRALL